MIFKRVIFLNAIEILDKNTLLVSDTGTGIIHKINVKNKNLENFIKIDSSYGGPNELLLKKGTLYVAGYDPNGKNSAKLISKI